MNMDQLVYFCAVVDEGTISAAGRRLHLSQPPLSLQIKNLEEEYGVKLFERGGRQIRLTDAGKLLYTYAKRILELKENADTDLKRLHSGDKGCLRIGVVSSASCKELFEGIKKFHHKYPEIEFQVYDGNTFTLREDLEKQRIEVAVIRTPFDETGLITKTILSDRFAVIGKEEFMTNLPKSKVLLSDLENKPLILYRRWEKLLNQAFAKEGMKWNPICINDDARTSLQWAEAGFGLALVPCSSLSLMPSLPYRILDEETFRSDICLVRTDQPSLFPTASLFFDMF